MSADAVFAVWLVVLGPVAGSFVTALADRHCRGLPLLYARSQCNACGRVLGLTELVPLWSYAWLRGRCRSCGAVIPRGVYAGEWAGLVLAALAVCAGRNPLEDALGALHLWLLLGLFQADFACFRLPDALTLPLLGTGLCLGAMDYGLPHAMLAAGSGAGAFLVLALSYRMLRGREGLGLGDVKLMAGLSAAVGVLLLPWITLVAALSALLLALLRAVRGQPVRGTTRVAFGCHLALAGGLVWALREFLG